MKQFYNIMNERDSTWRKDNVITSQKLQYYNGSLFNAYAQIPMHDPNFCSKTDQAHK
jgi:hypothetical protein